MEVMTMKKNNTDEPKRLDGNQVIITGEVSKVVRATDKIATFSIKCVAGKGDKTYTCYPTIKWFNPSDVVAEGDKVMIEGHIMTGSYDGKNGKVYTTDIVVDSIDAI